MPTNRHYIARTAIAAVGVAGLTQVPAPIYVLVGALVFGFGLVVFAAVFFPTAKRRRDARAVLRLLVDLLRPRRPS